LAKATRLIRPESTSLSQSPHVNNAPRFRLALCGGVGGGRPINECYARCITQARLENYGCFCLCQHTRTHKDSLGSSTFFGVYVGFGIIMFCLVGFLEGQQPSIYRQTIQTAPQRSRWLAASDQVGSARAEEPKYKNRGCKVMQSKQAATASAAPSFSPHCSTASSIHSISSIVPSLLARSLPTRKPLSPCTKVFATGKKGSIEIPGCLLFGRIRIQSLPGYFG
jgi:hypothetical protein